MRDRFDDLMVDVRYIKARVDSLHEKHDGLCQRVAKTETDARWMKGGIRLAFTGIITLAAALITKLFIK